MFIHSPYASLSLSRKDHVALGIVASFAMMSGNMLIIRLLSAGLVYVHGVRVRLSDTSETIARNNIMYRLRMG